MSTDEFTKIFGERRTSNPRTPWQELSEVDRERAIAAWIRTRVSCGWWGVLSDTSSILGPLRERCEDREQFEAACECVMPQLRAAVMPDCEETFNRSLSCGHHPQVNARGWPDMVRAPYIGLAEDDCDYAICRCCYEAGRLEEFARPDADRFEAHYDNGCLGTGLVGSEVVFAQIHEEWEAGNKSYWRAVDAHGRSWHGSMGLEQTYTIMHRKKARKS